MIKLDEYLELTARIAGEIVDITEYTADVLGRRYKSGDRAVVECVDFRRAMLTDEDRNRLNWQLQLGFFPDTLPHDFRLGGYAFAAEVAGAVLKLRARTLCAPYRRGETRSLCCDVNACGGQLPSFEDFLGFPLNILTALLGVLRIQRKPKPQQIALIGERNRIHPVALARLHRHEMLALEPQEGLAHRLSAHCIALG